MQRPTTGADPCVRNLRASAYLNMGRESSPMSGWCATCRVRNSRAVEVGVTAHEHGGGPMTGRRQGSDGVAMRRAMMFGILLFMATLPAGAGDRMALKVSPADAFAPAHLLVRT